MIDGIIWAAKWPLYTLDTTRSQTLSPFRPWRPATVHWNKWNWVYLIARTKAQYTTESMYLTWAVQVGLTSLRLSSLTNTNLTVQFYLLPWPVLHSCNFTCTLFWRHTLFCVAHHLAFWTPATWRQRQHYKKVTKLFKLQQQFLKVSMTHLLQGHVNAVILWFCNAMTDQRSKVLWDHRLSHCWCEHKRQGKKHKCVSPSQVDSWYLYIHHQNMVL